VVIYQEKEKGEAIRALRRCLRTKKIKKGNKKIRVDTECTKNRKSKEIPTVLSEPEEP